MAEILGKILPVFIALAIGYFTGKKKLISSEGIATFKNLVVNICLTAVLIGAFAETDFSLPNLKQPLVILIACILALIIGKALCLLFKVKGTTAPYLTSGFEAGMLGYSLFTVLYGSELLPAFAILDLGQMTFVFTIYRILISGSKSPKSVIDNIVKTPVIWGMVLGIVLSATGLYEKGKEVIKPVTDFISAPTSMIILLTIGWDMASGKINPKRAIMPVVARIIALGILFGIIIYLNSALSLGIHEGALLLMFSLPGPYVLPIFAKADEEKADIASALSIQTVLALAIFAVMVILK